MDYMVPAVATPTQTLAAFLLFAALTGMVVATLVAWIFAKLANYTPGSGPHV
jgi:hypothetical protein